MRKTIFSNEEYYHIYNRGVDKRDVFCDENDYKRFLLSMNLLNDEFDGLMLEYRDFRKSNPKAQLLDFPKLSFRKPVVEIISYCLNPNHYHFILKQISHAGIKKFMHKLGTSYTKYFNKKYDRSGVLSQGRFKDVYIGSNEYLLHLSAYVNRNYFIHKYPEKNWPYSSELDYIGKRSGNLCNKNIILDQFENDFSKYDKFLNKGLINLLKT